MAAFLAMGSAGLLGCGEAVGTVADCGVREDASLTTRLEGPSDPVEAALAYIEDVRVRRSALEASVSVAQTDYGDLRLDHYALEGACILDPDRDWEARPVYLPTEVRPLKVRESGEDAPTPAESGPVGELSSLDDLEDWVALGREAFHRYPVSVDARFRVLRERDDAEAFGIRVDAEGYAETLVESRVADGSWAVGITCATCHSRPLEGGARLDGPAHPQLDYGVITGDGWPLSTMDVTPDGIDNPVRPSDLRVYALQERIHHAGNLANGRIARMVRIETLLASQLAYAARPDRRIVAALVLYLDQLADELPRPDAESPGAPLFQAQCAGCHAGSAMAGPPIPVEQVQTDPRATVGSSRATGGYRSPSLLGVADRTRLLHDASANGLLGILGLDESEHVGHPFGLELSEADRWAIADYLGVAGP